MAAGVAAGRAGARGRRALRRGEWPRPAAEPGLLLRVSTGAPRGVRAVFRLHAARAVSLPRLLSPPPPRGGARVAGRCVGVATTSRAAVPGECLSAWYRRGDRAGRPERRRLHDRLALLDALSPEDA